MEVKAEINLRKAKINSAVTLTKEHQKDSEDKVAEIKGLWKIAEKAVKQQKENEDRIDSVQLEIREVQANVTRSRNSFRRPSSPLSHRSRRDYKTSVRKKRKS